jgi:hypothetical protein
MTRYTSRATGLDILRVSLDDTLVSFEVDFCIGLIGVPANDELTNTILAGTSHALLPTSFFAGCPYPSTQDHLAQAQLPPEARIMHSIVSPSWMLWSEK